MNLSGRRGQAAGRRERPRAEPVRPRRRVRAVAVRRAPSLRRQRELGTARCRTRGAGAMRAVFGGWQFNVIAIHNSGTPFTVSDSANVALQANSPPISGFPASRPNLVGDPNAGPRTVDEWISRSAFQRLNPADAGRTVRQRRTQHRARTRPTPTSTCRSSATFALVAGDVRLQFRAEVVQRRQPRELRPAGRRPELGQLRPHLLRRPAATDAVRGQAGFLDREREAVFATKDGGSPSRRASACSSASPRCSSTRSASF